MRMTQRIRNRNWNRRLIRYRGKVTRSLNEGTMMTKIMKWEVILELDSLLQIIAHTTDMICPISMQAKRALNNGQVVVGIVMKRRTGMTPNYGKLKSNPLWLICNSLWIRCSLLSKMSSRFRSKESKLWPTKNSKSLRERSIWMKMLLRMEWKHFIRLPRQLEACSMAKTKVNFDLHDSSHFLLKAASFYLMFFITCFDIKFIY